MTRAELSSREALATFYRAIGSFQSADNVGKLKLPLTEFDRSTLEAIKKASERLQ